MEQLLTLSLPSRQNLYTKNEMLIKLHGNYGVDWFDSRINILFMRILVEAGKKSISSKEK